MKNSIDVEEILNDEITMNMMSFPGFHQNKIKMQGRVGTKWPFDCPSLFDLPLSSVKFQQTFYNFSLVSNISCSRFSFFS